MPAPGIAGAWPRNRSLAWAADEPREPKVVTVTITKGDTVTLAGVRGDPDNAVSIEVKEVVADDSKAADVAPSKTPPSPPAPVADSAKQPALPPALPEGARVYQVTVQPPTDGLSYRVPMRVIAHDAEGKSLPERVFLVRAVAVATTKGAAARPKMDP